MPSNAKPLALVAMSGGVDSSVAAALLVRRGIDVVGVTMQIWQESQTDDRHAGCCSLGAVEDARRVARTLGIDHYVFNLREEFKAAVIDDFVSEYAAGRTPNPCVKCNRHVKFEVLREKAKEIGADYLVTGHYARIRKRSSGYRLLAARAADKDQSYVLHMLAGDDLKDIRFPMGEMPSKAHARALAADLGLHLANKPDSQEICFVSEAGGYTEFLKERRPDAFAEGPILDSSGREIGTHRGIPAYTIGQRRGIDVRGPGGRPLHVLQLLPQSNAVVVGPAEELERSSCTVADATSHEPLPIEGLRTMARIRSNMALVPAVAYPSPEGFRLEFPTPVRAVTPGQIAVAYRGRTVVAGGTIVG